MVEGASGRKAGPQASLKTSPDKSDVPLVRRNRPGVAFLTAVALAKEVAKTDGGGFAW